MKLDKVDLKILQFIQGDIPLTANPFQELAKSLNMSEQDIVNRIKSWQESGIVRRFGAVLRHQKAGYNTNAMVAWFIEENEADNIGKIMADHPRISHCYLREVPEEFRYNLFTMIHATSQEDLEEVISHISKTTKIEDYAILQSIKEYKKTSMKYV